MSPENSKEKTPEEKTEKARLRDLRLKELELVAAYDSIELEKFYKENPEALAHSVVANLALEESFEILQRKFNDLKTDEARDKFLRLRPLFASKADYPKMSLEELLAIRLQEVKEKRAETRGKVNAKMVEAFGAS